MKSKDPLPNYWFIEDAQGEQCGTPDTEEQRAVFWREYLEQASPHKGPYKHFLSPSTLSECGKIIPLKQAKDQ